MSRLAVAALGALLLAPVPAAPVLAQPAPAAKAGDGHALARAFLVKSGIDKQMDGIIVSTRDLMIATFKAQGLNEEGATGIADRFLMPEFRSRLPELLQRFEDVLVKDFTPAELQAMLDNKAGPDLTSAQAKAGQLPQHFSATGQEWGQLVGADAYAKNKAEIDKLAAGAKAKP